MDVKKSLNYLFETMKGILTYSKEGQFDLMFKEEGIIPSLGKIIDVCFIQKSDFILKFLK